MLALTTLFWGLSFPLMKDWQEAARGCAGGDIAASATLVCLRMALGLIVLALVRPRLFTAATRREHAAGALLGLVFALGFGFQVIGLAYTTPALSAFFTSLGGAWVPVLTLILFRQTVPVITLLGIGVAVAGAAVMGINTTDWTLGAGEVLTLLCAVLFAGQILLLDRLGRVLAPDRLTVGLFTVTAVGASCLATGAVLEAGGGLGDWLTWLGAMLGQPALLANLAIQTVFCTVLAFHWMNTYQPQVSAVRAGLIYFLEPVFASAFSLMWGHDEATLRLALGGLLILAGNLLVEVPAWRRTKLAAA